MKQYIKDMTPEEIISRLKNGEVMYDKDYPEREWAVKMIDGIVAANNGEEIILNASLYPKDYYYFEVHDEKLEVKVGEEAISSKEWKE